MLAYRRTSTFAVRALARNCPGAIVVGAKPGAQSRAEYGVSIGSRGLFSSLPEHIVVGMPGKVQAHQGACYPHLHLLSLMPVAAFMCDELGVGMRYVVALRCRSLEIRTEIM